MDKDTPEEEFKKKLTKEQYRILREAGTEPAGTSPLLHNKEKGDYKCAACGQTLFKSDAKFDSGTGWPSFDQAVPGAVEYKEDRKFFMKRTEVICSRCGSHLGHVFDDGPKETTGKRYCMNGCALAFKKK